MRYSLLPSGLNTLIAPRDGQAPAAILNGPYFIKPMCHVVNAAQWSPVPYFHLRADMKRQDQGDMKDVGLAPNNYFGM